MRGRIPRKYVYQQFHAVLLGYVIWCFLYIPFWAVVGIMTVKLFSIRLSKKSFVGLNMAARSAASRPKKDRPARQEVDL